MNNKVGEWITWELAKDLYGLEPSDFRPSCVDYELFMVRVS